MVELEAEDHPVVDRALDLAELLDEAGPSRTASRHPFASPVAARRSPEQPDRLGLGRDGGGRLEGAIAAVGVALVRVDPGEPDERAEIGRADGERRLERGAGRGRVAGRPRVLADRVVVEAEVVEPPEATSLIASSRAFWASARASSGAAGHDMRAGPAGCRLPRPRRGCRACRSRRVRRRCRRARGSRRPSSRAHRAGSDRRGRAPPPSSARRRSRGGSRGSRPPSLGHRVRSEPPRLRSVRAGAPSAHRPGHRSGDRASSTAMRGWSPRRSHVAPWRGSRTRP